MESRNNLETNGSLRINPLAELLVEISKIKLNGSLRMESAAQKIALYFDAGEMVFAVSNARRHRLFELLLQIGRMTKEELVAAPDFTNDLALKDFLLRSDSFTEEEIRYLIALQISEIVKTALGWDEGEWTFSPLVRARNDIRFAVDLPNMVIEYARNKPAEAIVRKFNNPAESFRVKSVVPANVNLSPTESFVFSRFENLPSTIEAIQALSGLPENETLKIIYTLWISGLLVRENWDTAFSERKVSAILSAHLALKKEEKPSAVAPPIDIAAPATETKAAEPAEDTAPVEQPLPLEEYLDRVDQATTFYEIFAVPPEASAAEIKQIYFSLAKRFHPDLFHTEGDEQLLQRIKRAFTRLAQAYDTLKTDSSREVYDFRMRKQIAEMKAVRSAETTPEEIDSLKRKRLAADNFEQGFDLLLNGDYYSALPFLARAVHYDNDNAHFHACYGKALSMDNKQRYKAEAELRIAIKLDDKKADYRIMLAEFFIQFNLLKRAEGELSRLLTIHPHNKEAQALLDSLSKK